MVKTVFRMKGVFPGEYESNVHVWDLDTGKIEFKKRHWEESSYRGRIWIDGIEINAKRASQLRRGFSSKKLNFTWGYLSHPTRITSLSICLYLFETEQTAVNMYLLFMKKVMNAIENKSFEMDFDITDFYLDHLDRTSQDFHTLYFNFGWHGNHEITFTKAQHTGEYYCDIRDQICKDLVEKEKAEYDKPPLSTLFGVKDQPKPPFDEAASYDKNLTELTDLYFASGQIRTKTKSTMISKIKFNMRHYGIARKEFYYEKNKDSILETRKMIAEFRQAKRN